MDNTEGYIITAIDVEAFDAFRKAADLAYANLKPVVDNTKVGGVTPHSCRWDGVEIVRIQLQTWIKSDFPRASESVVH